MGTKYTECTRLEFEKLFEDSSPSTSMFFILSPGVDPLRDVEKLGTTVLLFYMHILFSLVVYYKYCLIAGLKMGFAIDLGTLHNVSLGQGQEEVAERVLRNASKQGHWVILQVQGHFIFCTGSCSDTGLQSEPASATNDIIS